MKYKEIQLTENLIASKRAKIDKSLSEIQGIHFFFSAVTGTTTNKKKQNLQMLIRAKAVNQLKTKDNENLDLDSDMGLPEVRFYPGISYFICFSQTDGCHLDRFVQCLQQHDMDMDVIPIQVRLRLTEPTHTDDNGNSDMEIQTLID